jgi:TIR domain
MSPSESNDLFISYSHIDNRPWGAGQHCWVSEFHTELATRLEMLLGRDVRIWRDLKLNGNDELNDRILGELRNSRAFLCVISPRYRKSDWCLRELRLFREQVSAPGGVAGSTLFKVVKTPVERTAQPPEVQPFLGYEFFHETASGKVHEFYPSRAEDSQESKAFWQQIDDLAQDISKTLEATPSRPTVSGAGDGRKAIYLAEATGDVKVARDSVKRELSQHGYRILPDRTLPWSAEELVPLIEADLSEACLTVHPVGARYGFIPEGESRSIVELQLEAATARNGRCGHVIWVPPEAWPPAEARQQEFIEKLRHVYTERVSTELLEQKPVEFLKTRIVEKLEPRRPPPRAGTPSLRIYVICERADLPAVKPFEEHLRAQGFGVSRPLLEGEEQEVLQDHREMLVCCDAVLVYYGNAREAWLRAKQRDLWKAAGWGRTRPMLAQAVLVAPTVPGENREYGSEDFLVLGGEAASPPAVLSPFIEQIRTAIGAP